MDWLIGWQVQQRASAVSAAPGAGGLPDMASMMNKGAMKQAMDKMGGSAGLANLMKDPNMMVATALE